MTALSIARTSPPASGATINQPNGQASGQSASALASFSSNFDNFLTLLTAQLRNQDPLSPMNATEFTTQLVQFTGVEQMLQQNRNLEQLISLQRSWSATTALNYIGRTVEATGNGIQLAGGSATMNFTAGSGATTGTIVVRDAAGTVVRNIQNVPLRAGAQTYTWDGRDDRGNRAPDGVYTYEVAARNPQNNPVTVTQRMSGVVTGISSNNGEQALLIGNVTVPIGSVTSVRETAAAAR